MFILLHTKGVLFHAFSSRRVCNTHEHIERNRPHAHYVEKSVATSTLEKAGFVILSGEYIEADYTFPSLENFLTWYCASGNVDEKDILPCKKKSFAKKFVNDDGTVYVKSQIYRIIAKK